MERILDLSATRGLAPRLFELARSGGRLDLDLSGVSAVDRAGLALLVGCRRLSNSNGGRLRLLGAGPDAPLTQPPPSTAADAA